MARTNNRLPQGKRLAAISASRHQRKASGRCLTSHTCTHPNPGRRAYALYVGSSAGSEPKSPFVFTLERGAPFTAAGFARMIERAEKVAKLAFKAHADMLRPACGYALANRGHDTRALQAKYGHQNIQNIQHTVRCTELSPTRFKNFWRVTSSG